jgi:hypothetical protein
LFAEERTTIPGICFENKTKSSLKNRNLKSANLPLEDSKARADE